MVDDTLHLADIPVVENPPPFLHHKENQDYWLAQYTKYSPVGNNNLGMVQCEEFGRHQVALLRQNLVKELIRLESQGKAQTMALSKTIDILMGEQSVFRLVGEKHDLVRKSITPVLGAKSVKHRYEIIKSKISNYLQELSDETAIDQNWIQMFPRNKKLAFGISMGFIFGSGSESECYMSDEEIDWCLSKFYVFLQGFTDLDGSNVGVEGSAFETAMVAKREILSLLTEFLAEVRKDMECVKNGKPGLMDSEGMLYKLIKFIDEHNANEIETNGDVIIDDQCIIETALVSIFAGFETTGIALNNVLYFLHTFPEQISKVAEATKDCISYEDIHCNSYLEGFVRECLRLNPPGANVGKTLIVDHKFSNGVCLPKGTNCLMPMTAVNCSDAVFPEPLSFMPERFMKGGVNETGTEYIFMPFSRGMRVCPGKALANMEIKIVAVALTQEFEFEIDPTRINHASKDLPQISRYIDLYAKLYKKSCQNIGK